MHKVRKGISAYIQEKSGVILQNMNFSRCYKNRGKVIYGFDPQHHNKGKVKVRNNFKKIKFSIFRKSVILTVKVGIADFFGMSKEAIAWVKE